MKHLVVLTGAGISAGSGLSTCTFIPYSDIVAAAIQTKIAHLASIRRSDISDDATHDNILNRLAVRARHSRDFLAEGRDPRY